VLVYLLVWAIWVIVPARSIGMKALDEERAA